MAKIITDKELAEIITKVIGEDLIYELDQHLRFIEDLADVLCDHFGGERPNPAGEGDDNLSHTVGIHPDSSLPDDGGIWKNYDTDITFKDGKEL